MTAETSRCKRPACDLPEKRNRDGCAAFFGGHRPPLQLQLDLSERSPKAALPSLHAFALHARELLRANGAGRIADETRIQWNPRMKTCAGRADYRHKIISLNPRLCEHPGEVERTLLHELAHFLAQYRAGRRRILPHGPEWRKACLDLGIGDEKRCHTLPFAVAARARRFLYQCPECKRDFPRARRIKRAMACLTCCREHNRGRFDVRFRLKLVQTRQTD